MQKIEEAICIKGEAGGCRAREEMIARFENLDKIYFEVNKERSFKKNRRPLIHIGPEGIPYYGGGGSHRLAIAHILKIPFKARLGCVYISAFSYLAELRTKKRQEPGKA